eukprot:CAMPEP_0169164460 /NCGR_PEP_ID=MMETSP1015-20121227/58856_1 /TAXON_ID=342587 /ORGANISM="Karlodinium micrum, Strain CCMP2283" /LENGTH=127 /DNA_ID=CAMNT_0009236917 /DNA_START=203 /DNA_END=583 /DNA_ORIENTATION=-
MASENVDLRVHPAESSSHIIPSVIFSSFADAPESEAVGGLFFVSEFFCSFVFGDDVGFAISSGGGFAISAGGGSAISSGGGRELFRGADAVNNERNPVMHKRSKTAPATQERRNLGPRADDARGGMT